MPTVPSDSSGKEPRSDARSSESGGAGLGDLLRSARERRGLTIEQVSKETKISRTHLEALERGNLTSVPIGFYQRARIRAYARVVNLDQDLALDQLDRRPVPVAAAPRRPAPPVDETTAPLLSRPRVLMIAGVVLAAVVLGGVLAGRERARDGIADVPGVQQDVQTQKERAVATTDGVISGTPGIAPNLPSAASAEPALVERAPMEQRLAEQPPLERASVERAPVDKAPVIEPPPASASSAAPAAARSTAEPRVLPPPPNGEPKASTAQAVAPSAPPAGRAATAGLVVTSVPPGARVTVNGIAWGLTPVTIRYLPTGDKRIRVSKDGFAAEERVITLSEGGSATVDIRLRSPQ